MNKPHLLKLKKFIFVIFLFLISYFVYSNGFTGGFIFDDSSNLYSLNVYNDGTGFRALIDYLFSFHSGSLKRPISTITFLIDGTSWPTDAYPFKVTNYMIHLINGILLYFVVKTILIITKLDKKNASIIALLSTLLWFFHPFFVSTVMYVVQRMSMLPLTFSLLGIMLYCKGRLLFVTNKKASLLLMFSAIYVFTTLATLSKENGVLLPLIIYLFELIIIKKYVKFELTFGVRLLLFYIPIMTVVLALIYKFPEFLNGYERREFSMFERLLTETRVVMGYLYHLFIPDYFTEGVFTDGLKKSRGFLNPISTLWSFLLILLLVAFSILYRKKAAILSFSILFFFLAQLLESTFIPLELSYEHRAYLPSIFLFLPVSMFLIYISKKTPIYKIIPVAILIYLAFNTYLRASIWGDNLNLHLETAERFPESVRATTIAAGMMADRGFIESSIYMLEQAHKIHENIEIEANLLSVKCLIHDLKDLDIKNFNQTILSVKFTSMDALPFNSFIDTLFYSDCIENNHDYTFMILNNLKFNDGYKANFVKNYANYNLAKYYAEVGDVDRVLKEIKPFISETKRLPIFAMTSEILDILIKNKSYKTASEVLDLLNPLLTSSIYEKDIYSHKIKYKNYYKQIDELRKLDELN